jgi:hypothetical protein
VGGPISGRRLDFCLQGLTKIDRDSGVIFHCTNTELNLLGSEFLIKNILLYDEVLSGYQSGQMVER